MAQTIPFVVPDADTDGVAPGNPNDPGDCDVCDGLNCPVVVLNANDFNRPPAPAMYSALLKNAAVEKIPLPSANFCTAFESAGLKFAPYPPKLSRFSKKKLPSFPPPITRCWCGPVSWSTRI